MKKEGLPKQERLRSRKLTETLFLSGNSINNFPVRLVWMEHDNQSPTGIEVMFTVSSRRFKRAVDRNRIKRLLRENYRKNKQEFCKQCELHAKKLIIAFIYTGKDLPEYEEIGHKIIVTLQKLSSVCFSEKKK